MGVRLVLAEDNLLVREGVSSLLSGVDDLEIVAVCSGPDEARAAVRDHRPDVVLTDIRMPPTHTDEGIRLADEWRTSAPDVGVVVLSQYVDPGYALDLLARGTTGRGYVLKDHVDDIELLALAIRTVATGGSFIDDDVIDALVQGRACRAGSPLAELSTRETEVLAELATGRTNAAIARSLGISSHAIEKHTSSIFIKLGLVEDADVNRRVAAVLLFLGDRSEGPDDG
jgi:DNA-binding NarL/FixJ family response regulator